jgi:hypothetical protein
VPENFVFKAILKALLVPYFTFTLSGTAISSQFDIVYLCDGPLLCDFADPQANLYFTLPNGWAAERAFFYETAGGARAAFPSQTYIYDPTGAEPFVAVLNPRQWMAMNGPCAETWRGPLCHFESMDDAHLDGFQILLTSLKAMPLNAHLLSADDIAQFKENLSRE